MKRQTKGVSVQTHFGALCEYGFHSTLPVSIYPVDLLVTSTSTVSTLSAKVIAYFNYPSTLGIPRYPEYTLTPHYINHLIPKKILRSEVVFLYTSSAGH